MTDPAALRGHLRAPFSDAEVESMWRGVSARRARSSRRAGMALAIPAAAMVVVAVVAPRAPRAAVSVGPLALASGDGLRPEHLRAPASTPRALRLADRSVIALSPGAELSPSLNDGRALELQLRRGAVAFEVTPGGPRRWRVRCDLATVTVVGTAFTLDQRADALSVYVSHGTVWVDGAAVPGGHQSLTAGRSLTLRRPSPPAAAPTPPMVAPPPSSPPRRAPRPSTAASAPTWQLRASQGDAQGAWNALGDNGFAREAEAVSSPADLLSLADVARRSRHHDLAAPLLERFVREHPDHPEAAMAAFTLGRDELSLRRRPAEAARWFERALSLRPPRALEEDLRARLAESRLAAGERDGACEAARAYLAAFPQGRHAARLERTCPSR